ncbi:hypothetical protein EOPP23_11245 [Endozoicomonas sp. OPT23]|uniref:hypothetical protein n=1 Tax=Endozoicomonas sp. OPT23 TaxID=2072845 RepID=UPI00129BE1E1|nr:hypothetical protein [Endozoicomonas sp. OPT23]MRI33561.1 hypothetical protein [Endozoicomonas sp. OPT23]
MYRAFVTVVLAIMLLGCSPSDNQKQVSKLDEMVVSEFLDTHKKAFRDGEADLLQSLYSERAQLRFTNASGVSADSGRELLSRAEDLIERYGLNHKEELLERVIVVTGPDSAVIEQRARETWVFDERFNDFAIEVVSRVTIALENETPRIVNLNRRVVSFTGLGGDREDNLDDIFLQPQT